ncbi:hypothetical protein V490_00003 [Pseudogymnoascus sp. VKM F-3557]|nr:hypothetical protein V490_00003 [Pseudogymnoascus sp. VKM F-3557]
MDALVRYSDPGRRSSETSLIQDETSSLSRSAPSASPSLDLTRFNRCGLGPSLVAIQAASSHFATARARQSVEDEPIGASTIEKHTISRIRTLDSTRILQFQEVNITKQKEYANVESERLVTWVSPQSLIPLYSLLVKRTLFVPALKQRNKLPVFGGEMSQPQTTTFASYAYTTTIPNNNPHGDYNFQASTSNVGGSITFDEPIFNTFSSFSNSSQHLNLPQRYNTMHKQPVAYNLYAQEALARDYPPDLKRPLVGPMKSSHAITEEYAKADAVYVAKIARLPQIYSHYRRVLGDGNCGWRAIGYSYFETLQKLGSKDQLEKEIARMVSLSNFIETWCGYQGWPFEDMREEVLNLLRDLAATVHLRPPSDEDSIILQRFNDEEVSNAIIYFFRLLASAWLKANSIAYKDFIPDGLGVDNYSKSLIEPAKTEIEHLGMALLIDVLMKPVGIAIETVYLDRSEGTDVIKHIIRAEDESGIPIYAGVPLIHLLYRPGHYDILYKEWPHALFLRQQQIINGASSLANIQVSCAGVLNCVQDPSPITNFDSSDLSVIAGIPGLSMAPLGNHGFPSTCTPLGDCKPVLSPSYSFDTLVSSPTIPSVSPISTVSAQSSRTPILPLHSGPSKTQLARAVPLTTAEAPARNLSSQFRHSKYEYESDWSDPSPQQSSFQTNTFKNSHYNTAHYNNPNFQPEEWCLDDEERPHAPRRGSARHKSA